MYAQESMNMSWCMKSSWGPRIATQYVGTWNEIRLCAFLTPKLWGHFAGCLRQGWDHWGLAICMFKTDIYKVSFLVVAGGWYPKGGTLAPKDAQRRNSVGMLNSSHVLFTFYFMYVFKLFFDFVAWYVLYCLIILEFITVKDSGTCVFCIKKEPCVLIECSKAFSCAKAHCVWALSKPCCGFNVVLSLQRLSCVLNIEGHAIRHWLMHVSLPQMELILPMLIAFLRFVEWSWLGCCWKPITCWILVRLMFFH